MRLVRCISESKAMPGRLVVGEKYWIDDTTTWKDSYGDEYVQVFLDEEKENRVGEMLTSHFETIMNFIKEDSYTCPYCGGIVERENLPNSPEFKDAITKRDDIQCPNCGNYGMNYMTKGKVGYGMIGYTKR